MPKFDPCDPRLRRLIDSQILRDDCRRPHPMWPQGKDDKPANRKRGSDPTGKGQMSLRQLNALREVEDRRRRAIAIAASSANGGPKLVTGGDFRMARGADLTGIPSTFPEFTYSIWIKTSIDPETDSQWLWSAGFRDIQNRIQSGGSDNIGSSWRDFLNGNISSANSSNGSVPDDMLFHLMVAASLTQNEFKVWIDGTAVLSTTYGTVSEIGNQNDWYFGRDPADNAVNRLNAGTEWGEWWGDDQYITTPVGKFIDSGGGYLDPGDWSSVLIGFNGVAADWNAGTNNGTGGGFTPTGTVTDVSP